MPRNDDEGIEERDEDRPRRRRQDDDDDDEERSRRRRLDDDDDDDDNDRPRRRRRGRDEDDDDDDDRPRRRRRRTRPSYSDPSDMGFLDGTFANTNMVLLVLFPLCCGMIALIFGILGVATCRHPTAKQNAWIVLIISLVWIAIATIVAMARVATGHGRI